MNAITGLVPAKSGKIEFEVTHKDNDSIEKKEYIYLLKTPAHKIVSFGMAHVPEGRRIFSELTVYENLKMGAYTRNNSEEINQNLKRAYERFPRLEERKSQIAGTLSGGEQQMLAMGER